MLKGISKYEKNGYTYRLDELKHARETGAEFMLIRRLFRSDRTGETINPKFLRLCYPGRWYYDILRTLDYFRSAGLPYDPRMGDALEIIKGKRTPEGIWKLPAPHKGEVHFAMEEPGSPAGGTPCGPCGGSRVSTGNTLRMLSGTGLDYRDRTVLGTVWFMFYSLDLSDTVMIRGLL